MRVLCFVLWSLSLVVTPSLWAGLTGDQIVEDFNFFFESYKEAYVFWDLKAEDHDVDWERLRAEYSETLSQCHSKRALLRLINELQTRIHDGHCGNDGVTACGPISLIRASFVHGEGNRFFLANIKEDSSISLAGAAVGDELLMFGGKSISALVKQGRALFAASSKGQFWSLLARNIHVWHPYLGEAPPLCEIKLRKPDGTILEMSLPWEVITPKCDDGKGFEHEDFVRKIVEIDAQGPLPMEARIYGGNVGYIKVSSFMKMSNPKEQFDSVFSAVADTRGLIIDVRDNGGGIGAWGVLLASYLVPFDKPSLSIAVPNDAFMDILYSKTVIRMAYAQAPEEYVDSAFGNPILLTRLLNGMGVDITQSQMAEHFSTGRYTPFYKRKTISSSKPGISYYENPVVVLTNGGSYSTTDIFLSILKEFNRIKTVGTPNGAGSGSPVPVRLKHSRVNIMVPHAKAFPHTGAMIEGRPVAVDIPVEITQKDLVAGIDRHVETALSVLGGKSSSEVVVREPSDARTPQSLDSFLSQLIPDSVKESIIFGDRR